MTNYGDSVCLIRGRSRSNPKELGKQATIIKKLLRKHTNSPLAPLKGSNLEGRLLLKKAFPFRKARILYRAGIRIERDDSLSRADDSTESGSQAINLITANRNSNNQLAQQQA